MSDQVREWLPVDVATREPVRAAVTNAVAAWSTAWFGADRVGAGRFTAVTAAKQTGEDDSWRVYRHALAISLSQRAAERLLDWALDADAEGLCASPVDRALVEGLRQRLIDDLVLRVETALGIQGEAARQSRQVEEPFGADGGVIIELCDDRGGHLLCLALAFAEVLPFCRTSLPAVSRRAVKLDSFDTALAGMPVTVEATLGAALVTLADLRSLAPGDVVVLETPLDGAATISLSRSERRFATGVLSDSEGAMALTLQA